MPAKPIQTLAIATGLAMAACANSTPNAREAAMSSESAASNSARMQPVKQWPLKFASHKFSVFTYDTYGAKVTYAGPQIDEDPDQLQRASSSYGPGYQRSWSGIHGMIRNFPPPAKVAWRSKDGQAHEAEIDFGEIFKDELIRHNVSREQMADVPDGKYQNEPSIILEVNDRTIRVWMKAHIPTKQLQKPGNKYSDFRSDLVLAKTYNY
jgi:hypothetical protein